MDTRAELQRRVQRATNIASAAQMVCDSLVAAGYPLVSVYLSRSGRLRCFAAAGYSQVLDGFPPISGVISATTRTGQPHVVEVATSDIYLKAAPGVVAEVCVPVMVDGTAIGALNIESQRPLGADTVGLASEAADVFAERLRELGGLPAPTGWMYLADQATRLVQVEHRDRLFHDALEIARTLSSAESAMLAIGDVPSGFTVAVSSGTHAQQLAALPDDSLNEIGSWVDGPMACYTVDSGGQRFAGFDQLGEAASGTLVVIALARGDQQLGYFVVADRRATTPNTDLMEQLELLGSLVSSSLCNIRNLTSLRDLARRDPLTGLGHNSAFGDRLQRIRDHHATYAVLAIDIDNFKAVNDTYGHQHGNQVICDLADAMRAAIRVDDALFRTGGDEFAAVVAVSGRDEALAIALRMETAARDLGTPVSIGVALNDDEHDDADGDDLFARADEALYRAKRAGRNVTMVASTLPSS